MSSRMNLKLIVNIACDDVNPKKGYRILGEPAEKWFRELNGRYGCKFDLFVPSCYHHEYPLSENKEWVRELASIDYFSLQYHGHFHQCKDAIRFGECEFFELTDTDEISQRLHYMSYEWDQCGILPTGFRPPGWLISDQSRNTIQNHWYNGTGIYWVAIHYEHNRGMQWRIKTFFGHDGIQQENISIHNVSEDGQTGMIMFQSHIFGNHNHNVWNEANFEQLKISLEHLIENYSYSFKTLAECLNN